MEITPRDLELVKQALALINVGKKPLEATIAMEDDTPCININEGEWILLLDTNAQRPRFIPMARVHCPGTQIDTPIDDLVEITTDEGNIGPWTLETALQLIMRDILKKTLINIIEVWQLENVYDDPTIL
jgi:hypothetical protein